MDDLYDLLRIGGRLYVTPRGTAARGHFVCTVSGNLVDAMGWGEPLPCW